MRLSGKVYKDSKIVKEAIVNNDNPGVSFRDMLEECLIILCKELDIQVPLWLRKNTTEFVNYRRTFFTKEHFVEQIAFDRFEIRIEQ